MVAAYESGAYTVAETRYSDVHYMVVSGRRKGILMDLLMLELPLFPYEKSLICRKKSIDRTHKLPINLPWNLGHFA